MMMMKVCMVSKIQGLEHVKQEIIIYERCTKFYHEILYNESCPMPKMNQHQLFLVASRYKATVKCFATGTD